MILSNTLIFITKCETMSDLETAILEYLKNEPEISVKDLLNEVKSIVKSRKEQLKKEKKESDAKAGVVKPLNPYQLFVKEQMKKFKDDGTTLTGKELMREISTLWKQKKEEAFEDGVADSDAEDELSTPPQSPVDSSRGKVVETSTEKKDEKKDEKKKAKGEKK